MIGYFLYSTVQAVEVVIEMAMILSPAGSAPSPLGVVKDVDLVKVRKHCF